MSASILLANRSVARPLPEGTIDHATRYSLAQRVHVLALLGEGCTEKYVAARTGVNSRTVNRIWKKAQELGFDPKQDSRILDSYVLDKPRSGRPKGIASEKEHHSVDFVSRDRADREKSSEVLAYEVGIASISSPT